MPAAQGDPHVWILKYGSGDIEALVTTDFVSVGSYTARMSLGNWKAMEGCNLEIRFFHPNLVSFLPTLRVHIQDATSRFGAGRKLGVLVLSCPIPEAVLCWMSS